MKAALAGGSVLVALILGLCAGLSAHSADAGIFWQQTERSSARVLRGHAICTASVGAEVQAGHAVSVKFTLRSVSRHPIALQRSVFDTALAVKAADGTAYDSNALLRGISVPPPITTKLRAGATVHMAAARAAVRWRGPLRVTPKCLGKALPALNVTVDSPWPGPASSALIGEVAAAAGHLLDHCLPQTLGVAVSGQIHPPSGTASPMNAQCSISVSSEGTFDDAQVLVLVPSVLAGVQIFQPYETLWPNGTLLGLTVGAPYEAIAWEFVVTRFKATPLPRRR